METVHEAPALSTWTALREKSLWVVSGSDSSNPATELVRRGVCIRISELLEQEEEREDTPRAMQEGTRMFS